MHAFTGFAGATRNSRRLFLALITAVLAVGLAAGYLTSPAQAADTDTRGLFGSQDPTYDGVYRQSAAIMGLTVNRAPVPRAAVDWLLRQQCSDGSFAAFRADTQSPCPEPDPVNFTGPDVNSTAMAVMALESLNAGDYTPGAPVARAAQRAAAWLRGQQAADGGWEWIRGLGSDSTSTGMALAALGRKGTPGFRQGAAWLRNQMIVTSECAVPFQPAGPVDPLSTSWTLIGAQGSLPYDRHRGKRLATPCTDAPATLLAAGDWLTTALVDGDGRLPSAFDATQTDWNSTALATLGVSQSHGSTKAMRLGVVALQDNVTAYATSGDAYIPAALGTLLMVAHASGANPRDFGGVNLTQRLLATLQK